jgi:hypothetical protein
MAISKYLNLGSGRDVEQLQIIGGGLGRAGCEHGRETKAARRHSLSLQTGVQQRQQGTDQPVTGGQCAGSGAQHSEGEPTIPGKQNVIPS